MSTAKEFIADFADYLGSPDRLPFLVEPYVVESPDPDRLQDCEIEYLTLHQLTFYMKDIKGEKIGRINLNFNDPTRLYIGGIGSQIGEPIPPRKGLGREILRRAVWYAYEHGCDGVETSIYVEDASSFWPSMGFRSKDPHKINWGDLPPDMATAWKNELISRPDQIWEFARTEFGRRALYDDGGPGILDLKDETQRNYAFRRLRLPENARR